MDRVLGRKESGALPRLQRMVVLSPSDSTKRTQQRRGSLCNHAMLKRGGAHLPPKEDTAKWSTVDGEEVAVMDARRRVAEDLRGVAPFRTDSSGER